MLNVDILINSAESCLGWPYVSPGTNDKNGIDCSGLFVRCYRDQGAKIAHGSNTIFHDYCSRTEALTNVGQLQPGMAVFKCKAWTDADKDNKWYGAAPGNLSHIGLVVSVNPLQIIHASSEAGCVTIDKKIGKWKYCGYLKDVNYSMSVPTPTKPNTDNNQSGGVLMTATVYASNGQPVNMRTTPSKAGKLITKVPVGTTVDVKMNGAEWSLITYKNQTGYMMTDYLDIGNGANNSGDSNDVNTPNMIMVERSVLQDIYNQIDMLLHG